MNVERLPNHSIDPKTGFLENPAYANQFDATKKNKFLKLFYDNGLRIRRTCDELGISVDTIHRHYKLDTVFKTLYDDVQARYLDELEGVSRLNALNPRSVIERIFQLKCNLPDKYGQENRPQNTQITINIDGNLVNSAKKRAEILDVEDLNSTPMLATGSNVLSASDGGKKKNEGQSFEQEGK